ncbi:MAG: hypothetical protein EXQ59_01935 [Acidobacteria bacterium]|nr:hypothetical protein [Acidobacteriota bacterium]
MAGYKVPAELAPRRRDQDDWGLYDPEQAEVAVVLDRGRDERAEPAVERTSSTGRASSGAVYTLESALRCPQCAREIRAFRVLRVLRTQVSFTSTLPRKGYVIVCPECDGLLSAELSGLI